MARAAALARLEQGPLPLSSLLKELSSFDKNELESTVLQLEKEGIISSVQAPYQDSKIKIYYIARKVLDAPAKDVSESSSPSAPAPKGLSTALQERLQRKRAFMSPVKDNDPKRTKSPADQEESKLTSTIKLRKAQIEDLKRKKALAEKSANQVELDRLQELSTKWGNACREIIRSMQCHAHGSSLGEMLKSLRIPPEMLGYCAKDDDFTLPFKSLDQIKEVDEPEPQVQAPDD